MFSMNCTCQQSKFSCKEIWKLCQRNPTISNTSWSIFKQKSNQPASTHSQVWYLPSQCCLLLNLNTHSYYRCLISQCCFLINLNTHTYYQPVGERSDKKWSLSQAVSWRSVGTPVSDQKWSLSQAVSWRSVGSPCEHFLICTKGSRLGPRVRHVTCNS